MHLGTRWCWRFKKNQKNALKEIIWHGKHKINALNQIKIHKKKSLTQLKLLLSEISIMINCMKVHFDNN